MAEQERTFYCINCGATVVVEFSTYVGGPWHIMTKNCVREYTDQAQIDNLVATKPALGKKNCINERRLVHSRIQVSNRYPE
jgi:hypothetical protein